GGGGGGGVGGGACRNGAGARVVSNGDASCAAAHPAVRRGRTRAATRERARVLGRRRRNRGAFRARRGLEAELVAVAVHLDSNAALELAAQDGLREGILEQALDGA